MEGYLVKKKNGNALRFFTNYTKRYFQIDPQKNVFQYSVEKGKPPKKTVQFNVSKSLLCSVLLVSRPPQPPL